MYICVGSFGICVFVASYFVYVSFLRVYLCVVIFMFMILSESLVLVCVCVSMSVVTLEDVLFLSILCYS